MENMLHIDEIRPVCTLLTGVPYGHAPYWYEVTARPLCMDLILPKHRQDSVPRTVIVWLCGGAFQQMDRSIWLPTLFPYAEQGYAIASVDYRVAAQAPYPAAVQDVKTAIRFLRAHSAEFCIDPERIAVMGESAGGYLAAMAAVDAPEFECGDWLEQSSRVQAVVDYYGKVEFPVHGDDPDCERALAAFLPDASLAERASVPNRIGPDAPPFLIFHGEKDPLVPIQESFHLRDALVKNGVRADLYVLEGEGHGTDAFYQAPVRKIVLDFLNDTMK